jgi:hypothetical protein
MYDHALFQIETQLARQGIMLELHKTATGWKAFGVNYKDPRLEEYRQRAPEIFQARAREWAIEAEAATQLLAAQEVFFISKLEYVQRALA